MCEYWKHGGRQFPTRVFNLTLIQRLILMDIINNVGFVKFST